MIAQKFLQGGSWCLQRLGDTHGARCPTPKSQCPGQALLWPLPAVLTQYAPGARRRARPVRKQAVSHPPTKTPQHSKTRQQPAVQGKQRWGSGGKPVRGFVCAFTRNRRV
ncbi:hypothetical protein DIJ64_06650 [Mycobacterium leprae]|uniref:Uncharacterized protein n=1 Tax=Mycobacterium leprae TaxID=1769 RepID=A0AAD0KV61_MYCLR|nr:hypothetical protein DIJ64_06650 [Mycobacterium leprae]